MRRSLLSLLLTLLASSAVWAASLSAEQRQATVAYVNSLQNTDGGFRAGAAAGASQLGNVNSALRALKYMGGRPHRPEAVAQFIAGCYHPDLGAYSETPETEPNVRSTAMGVMATAELKKPLGAEAEKIIAYFDKNTQTLPDIYIAAAALDAAGLKPPAAGRWAAAYGATRNADGTYGKGPADAASVVITTLRVGGELKDRAALARAIKAAQQRDGGFAGMGDASDMASTYRMMRASFMLKEKPDLERLRAFVARCRNADGGYGNAPGQPSAIGPTYFSSIVLHWADEMEK